MKEPCMCGDPYCSSCGSLQGNCRCPYCGKWPYDGGCDDPGACNAADKKFCEGMAEMLKEDAEIERMMIGY